VEVKSLWPISVGLHTCYKGEYSGRLKRKLAQFSKNHHSSDCGLQFARMKLKSLVIVNHDVTVKVYQTLHTPPIMLEECMDKELTVGDWGK